MWSNFLSRTEACRLDVNRHEKNRIRYMDFLQNVSREVQDKDFLGSVLRYFATRGAVDAFGYLQNNPSADQSFCLHICHLFERKLESWFDSCDAIAVRLTGHVKVSNLVRVLTGQIDALCQREGIMYAINVKVTGMDTPRPLDIAELSLYKILAIQNGLCNPNSIKLCLLTLHLTQERPILRLWEYTPTDEMEQAIREADVDKLIDAGNLSQCHEYWQGNVHMVPIPYMAETTSTHRSYRQA